MSVPPTSARAERFWLGSAYLTVTQASVQLVNFASGVLAVGFLPVHQVGLVALQTALMAWLYFTHAGTLNYLYTELPRLQGAGANAVLRDRLLQGALGILLRLSFPATALLCLPLAFVYFGEIGSGGRLAEFYAATVLATFGSQWTQLKECEIKAAGNPLTLGRWHGLQSLCGLVPLGLLTVAPAYEVFLFRPFIAQGLIAAAVFAGGDRVSFLPARADVGLHFRGGAILLISQVLGVLLLQGERMLMAYRFGVAAVGSMQLYFLLHTGAQLIPATIANLWFPRAQADPTGSRLSEYADKALRFGVVALVGAGLAAGGASLVLHSGWLGAAYVGQAEGLGYAALMLPAHLYSCLTFVFIVRREVKVFLLLQAMLLAAQVVLYLAPVNQLTLPAALLCRGVFLYLGLAACLLWVRLKAGPRTQKEGSPAGLGSGTA